MAKKYSDMTNEELVARIEELVARIEELEDELREAWEETVCCGGRRHDEGLYAGWWSHQCLSAVRGSMFYLVRAGYWERHHENDYYARPIEEKAEPDVKP